MKQANCQLLGIGIESASQEILDRAKKQEKVEDLKRAVSLCKKVGIRTMGHFIFGLPGETRQSAESTIRFIKELRLDYIQCYNAVPYPKTELWEYAKKHNLIESFNWQNYDFDLWEEVHGQHFFTRMAQRRALLLLDRLWVGCK